MSASPEAIEAAQDAQSKWGVPASISLAQFGLESGWGAHMPQDSNNPFGYKAVPGQPSVLAQTHEFVDGRYVSIEAPFRRFSSLAEAFDSHASLLASGTPYRAAMKLLDEGITEASVNAFANALTGVYATDPRYGAKLIQLMQEDGLYRYNELPVTTLADKPVVVQSAVSNPISPPPAPPVSPAGGAQAQGPMSQPDFTPPVTAAPTWLTMVLTPIIRAGVLGVAGVLFRQGWVTSDQETQFVTIGISVGLGAGALVWSLVEKKLHAMNANTRVAEALATPVPKVS